MHHNSFYVTKIFRYITTTIHIFTICNALQCHLI